MIRWTAWRKSSKPSKRSGSRSPQNIVKLNRGREVAPLGPSRFARGLHESL